MTNMKQLGKTIMLYRKSIGLSQEYVSKQLGLSRTSLVQIEKGKRSIDFFELINISKILGFDINEIYNNNVTSLFDDDAIPVDKAENVLLYVLEQCAGKPNVGETVLYKLLYFIDFNYYELKNRSLTGLKYRKLPYGPVPVNIGKIFKKMAEEDKLCLVNTDYHGFPQKRYLPLKKVVKGKLKKPEMDFIDVVIDKLSDMSATRISEYSHNDIPWKVSKDMDIINYNLVRDRKPPYKMKGKGT